MILKVSEIYDATFALIDISNRPRVIPSMAKFKLARMHDILEPIFRKIEETERVLLVHKFGSEKFADPEKTQSRGFNVDPIDEGYNSYIDAWGEISKREMEVKITPITTTMVGNDPKGLEVLDFKMLSRLVVDNTEE